ncbi:ADP-forming succinate--CoA ligase subunit beta [Thermoplasmatales archaeon SW_10_69_26]|nr:MAG: ADP-forming succinate--CoA ligase subunit beta [Thermoplasmatales archaeon SW_10_69_26]
MKLKEYQGRELFQEADIPAPEGTVVSSLEEFDEVADDLAYPVVVKAQVLAGGRGKAGGVKFADDAGEAREHVDDILGMEIKGLTVDEVLLVKMIEIEHELYASVLVDRSQRLPMVMVSPEGGVDIESVPDEDIYTVNVNPFTGFSPYHARQLLAGLDVDRDVEKQLASVLGKMFELFQDRDADLVEINPLAITPDGDVVAADSKFKIDDSADFRNQDVEASQEDVPELEREANEKGIAFVELEGDIGVIANGAGLTMATLDAIEHYGGKGGTFLDLGGTDDPEKVKTCFDLLTRADPSVIFLNLFGGITKADTVAEGVVQVLEEEGLDVPLVTRIRGVNEERAREMLRDAGVTATQDLKKAAEKAVQLETEASNGGAR